MGPYRASAGSEVLEAPTRDGTARLDVAPDHTQLSVALLRVEVTPEWLTVVSTADARRARPQRSMLLEERKIALLVARAWPTDDVGLWYELPAGGLIGRVVGLRPLPPLDREALAAGGALERLAGRLERALAAHAGGARRALELGHGGHRVVLVWRDDRVLLYARPIFRELPRRSLEVHADGTVLVTVRGGVRCVTCRSSTDVTVFGDWLRFEDAASGRAAKLWLPWIGPDERRELCECLGRVVDAGAVQ